MDRIIARYGRFAPGRFRVAKKTFLSYNIPGAAARCREPLAGKEACRMNILLCTSRMCPGGAETHVLTLARQLAGTGHTVSVASSGGALVRKLEESGVRHVAAPLDRKDALSVIRSARVLAKAAKGADIVHAHGRIPAFICSLLSRLTVFPPFLTTAHGFYDPAPPKGRMTAWGSRVIAVSEDVAGFIRARYRLPGEMITVIPNGVAIPAAGTPADRPRFVTSGRLDRDNYLSFLAIIETYKKLAAAHPGDIPPLTVIGGGNAEAALRSEAKKTEAGEIMFTGAVADAAGLLRPGDVFIGRSRAAIEAAAAGLAVIPFSEHGCAGILLPENADEAYRTNMIPAGGRVAPLCGAMEDLAYNGELRLRAAAFAREIAGLRWNITDITEKTLDVYRSVIEEHRKEVTLCGYFGHGNAGDEATFECVRREIENRLPGFGISVLAGRRAKKESRYEGVVTVPSRNPFAISAALRRSRLFILCGGSLLQNATSNRSLAYYCAVTRLAARFGCRTGILGGGIGPLRGNNALKSVEKLLSSLDTAGFRDEKSRSFAASFLPEARLGADPALAFRGLCGITPPAVRGKTLLAVLRPSKGRAGSVRLREEAEAAVESAREKGLEPVIAAMSAADVRRLGRLARKLGAAFLDLSEPRDALAEISSSSFVIAGRLHAAVFAATSGTPAVCLAYDPKVTSFAEVAGYPAISPEGDVREGIRSAVHNARTPDAANVRAAGERLSDDCGSVLARDFP